MKKITLTILTCLIFLSPNMVMSETMDDLVKRDGVYFKKFSDVPFTGNITGEGSFKNGKMEGVWVTYNPDGIVNKKYTGTYKNGKKIRD
jgi:antitoxin component YwqK of YwqJK toxin-antitoxin module